MNSILFILDRINRIYWIFLFFVSDLRPKGLMGRWLKIDENKKYPENPVDPVRFKIIK